MKVTQTFKTAKFKIETTYQKSSFMRKPKLINVHRELVKLKMFDKKCNFAPCISKINEKAQSEFQFVSFFQLNQLNVYLR